MMETNAKDFKLPNELLDDEEKLIFFSLEDKLVAEEASFDPDLDSIEDLISAVAQEFEDALRHSSSRGEDFEGYKEVVFHCRSISVPIATLEIIGGKVFVTRVEPEGG